MQSLFLHKWIETVRLLLVNSIHNHRIRLNVGANGSTCCNITRFHSNRRLLNAPEQQSTSCKRSLIASVPSSHCEDTSAINKLEVLRCEILVATAMWASCWLELHCTASMLNCTTCTENLKLKCLCSDYWAQWLWGIAYEKSIAALVRSGACDLSANEWCCSTYAR